MTSIRLDGVSKTYTTYRHGLDRLTEIITGSRKHTEFIALHPIDLHVARGEVLGIIGMNGAGKSTLLKIIAGTMQPSSGSANTTGVVSALLELGTGFHPEMTGRENIYLYGTVMGMSHKEIDRKYPEIVEFSGIQKFMEQPVKTYSSGMFVRLAFSVATSVDPDILIVDEALSVGDGAFARKSFERIMGFKEAGKTIVFCSHSLYQVEAVCSRVLWLHEGKIKSEGAPPTVISEYDSFLSKQDLENSIEETDPFLLTPIGQGRLKSIKVRSGAQTGRDLQLVSGQDDLLISIDYLVDPKLPSPSVAIALVAADGRTVCSAISKQDGVILGQAEDGSGNVSISFPRLSLLKGKYTLQVYLACEYSIHSYDMVLDAATINMTQIGIEQGIVSLPRLWNPDLCI